MLRKITLKNFMSHAETVIDLADGLTVLTGPNNCGKSAIVAALQTLATNGRTKHVTRHGEKIASVTVETDEGDCVQWERKGNTVKYVINGEDIHRVGQNIPEGLHEILKLDRVDLGTGNAADRYDIHFGEQKSPVFLLGDSGRRSAQFFASSSDVSRLMEMQALHRNQVRDQKKEKKRLEKKSEENIARLAVLGPIVSINDWVSQAEDVANKVADRASQCERLNTLVKFLERKQAECDTLKATSKELARLDLATTSLADLESERDACSRLATLRGSLVTTQRQIGQLNHIDKALAKTKSPPQLEPAGACQHLLNRLTATQESAARLRSSSEITKELRSLPVFQDTDRLQRLAGRINTAQAQLRSIESANRMLTKLRVIDSPQDTAPLNNVLGKLKTRKDAQKNAETVASKAHDDLQRCADSIETFVLANPTCTVCGGDVDAATLMSSASGSHSHAHTPPPKSTKQRRQHEQS